MLIETKTDKKKGGGWRVLFAPLFILWGAMTDSCERVLRNNSVLWLAWRNLINPRRGFGLSAMTFVSIAGVTLGVMALTVVLSVMGGFERDMKAKMLKGLPHLEVYLRDNPTHGFSLHQYPLTWFRQAFPRAELVEPFVQVDVVLKHNRHLSSAVLFAVEPTKGGQLWGFRQRDALLEGSYQGLRPRHRDALPGILLGDGLAVQMGAEVGDEITILNPNSALTAAGGLSTTARVFALAGIFHTGLFTYDGKWAVIALPEGRKFLPDYDVSLDEEQYVSGVALNFSDPDRVEHAAQLLAKTKLKGLTWKETNSSLIFALQLEKFAMGAILMLIVLVAAFSISGTMMMTVFYRRHQIALLRAMGLTARRTYRVFLTQGVLIGTIGVSSGVLLGIAILLVLANYPIPLPQEIYYLGNVPVRFLWYDYLIIGMLAWLLSLLSAVYPAAVATKEVPSKGLRFQ